MRTRIPQYTNTLKGLSGCNTELIDTGQQLEKEYEKLDKKREEELEQEKEIRDQGHRYEVRHFPESENNHHNVAWEAGVISYLNPEADKLPWRRR